MKNEKTQFRNVWIYNMFKKKKSEAALDFHELDIFAGPEQWEYYHKKNNSTL